MPFVAASGGLAVRDTTAPTLTGAAAARIAALPDAGAYRLPNLPKKVYDQQALNCCVSCALTGAMEVLSPAGGPLSPLFHYHVTRYERLGSEPDGSLLLTSGLSTLQSDGVCAASLYAPPFTESGAAEPPSDEAVQDARQRRLLPRFGFSRAAPVLGVSRAEAIKEQLRKNQPAVLGFVLPAGYPVNINRDGQWRDPEDFEASATGHCVLAVGFDDLRRALLVQDSRGPAFADAGRWWMGYRVVDSSVVKESYYFAL